MCSFQIIEPSPLHDIVRPFGLSPPLGEMPKAEGVFSLGRQAGFTVFLIPKVLHDIVRPIGPSPPPGENQRGGVFPERSEVGLFSLGRQAGFTLF